MIQALLFDIEGTTSSIRFVYDALFPYVRRELPAYLRTHWNDAPLQPVLDRIARDDGAASFTAWCGAVDSTAARDRLERHLFGLMNVDSKAGGLKELQGLISRGGYASGELRSHVYPDVLPALQRWSAQGKTLAVYSSGSVAAQKSFFAFTEAGDLLPYFKAHFDTDVGAKRASGSYRNIAAALKLQPGEILFFSDVAEELDAARNAGLSTYLVVRPGNKPAREDRHTPIHSFDEVTLVED